MLGRSQVCVSSQGSDDVVGTHREIARSSSKVSGACREFVEGTGGLPEFVEGYREDRRIFSCNCHLREIQPIGSPSSHLGNSVLIRVYPLDGSGRGAETSNDNAAVCGLWLRILARVEEEEAGTVGSGKQQGPARGGYNCWRQLGKAVIEVAMVYAIMAKGKR
ncbi:hypothetical protein B296_00039339 [Ensete ventricosum]|uniref:Uncharacterized protein n=1 Tax=Ensete ventricosum TaxID=4639 RepID=A0A426XMI9_ENSVE|nr:hypothetical protein B296_00039339 [Ensete ventricosum]